MAKKKSSDTNPAPTETKGLTFSGRYHYANGKRKNAVARIRLYENGQGRIIVNGKPYKDYLTIPETYEIVQTPLRLTNKLKDFDIEAPL